MESGRNGWKVRNYSINFSESLLEGKRIQKDQIDGLIWELVIFVETEFYFNREVAV